MALAPTQRRSSEDGNDTDTGHATHLLHRYLLLLRFALANIVAFVLLIAVYLQGWLDGALLGYTIWLSLGISAVFVFGLVLCGAQVWRTSVELNDVRAGVRTPGSRAHQYLADIEDRAVDSRSISANLLRLSMTNRIAVVRHLANTLVFLGLVGTVIGFIVALSGVKPELSATVENVAPMVTTLINGMSIALYTTLIGAVLHVWLITNYRILATGTVHLFNAIVESGERSVGRR